MFRWVARWWATMRQNRRLHRKALEISRLVGELPGLDEAIDTTPPDDVERVAAYLWAATCWDRQRTSQLDYALAAVIWLNYGQVRLPAGAAELGPDDLRGLPFPYGDRSDVTP